MGQVVYNPSNDLIQRIGSMAKRLARLERGNSFVTVSLFAGVIQSIPNAAWTRLTNFSNHAGSGNTPLHTYSTECVSNASGVFQPLMQGLYEIEISCSFTSSTITGERALYMCLNKTTAPTGTATDSREWRIADADSYGYVTLEGSKKMYLTPSDRLYFWCYQSSGATVNVNGQPGDGITFEFLGAW